MIRATCCLILGAALAFAQTARPDYAIINARIVVSPDKTLPAGTIVVRDGLIQSVGEGAPPPEFRVYDAKGLTVYPGLIDAASHYGFPIPVRAGAGGAGGGPLVGFPAAQLGQLPQVPDDIASPIRYLNPEPSGVNADVISAARLIVPAQPDARRSEGFTSVLSIPREGYWQGTSSLVQLGDGPSSAAVIIPSVAMHVSTAIGGGGGRRYPTSLMGVMAILRQSLLRAQQYRDAVKLYDESGRKGLSRPQFDRTSAALLPVLDGTMPVVFTANSAEQIRRALRFADEFKLRPIILGGAEAWRVTDTLKAKNVPVLVDLSMAPATAVRGADAPANHPDRLASEANPGKLEKAGIQFALVTAGAERTDRVRERIAVAIARGLSPQGALRALTVAPAEIMGAGAQLGTVETGKIANLTMVEGDLLSSRARVRSVMIDGKLYFPSASPRPGVPQRGPRGGGEAGPPPSTATAAQSAPGATGQNLPTTPGPAAQTANAPVPQTPDDPTPVTPRAASPADTSASTLPARRPPDPEPAPRDLVIRNATLLTITKGVIANGSIWVQNGKIKEVGGTVNAPADAKIIDGSGRFVMPGIVDSHSHAAMSGGVNETGASVTAMTRVTDVIDPDDINIYRAAAAGVTTLNILHGSANVIGGQNAVIKTKWGSPVEQMFFPGAPAGIKMALGENPKRSGQTTASRFPASRMGVENVVRESFRAAREYAKQWESYRARTAKGEKVLPPEKNLTLDALTGVLSGEILVHAHCYRADEISMLLDLADEFGFKIRSLQHVLEGYKVTEKIRKHGAGASTFADFWGYKMEAFDGTAYNAAMLMKAGIRTAINSDSSERHRRLFQDAAKTMKYGGLTEEQALRTITADPAWMLGVEKRIGALEPGMDADMAIFNAHPFSAYARVEMTVVDGQIVFDRERDIKARVPWREEFEPDGPAPASGAGHDDDIDHEEEIH